MYENFDKLDPEKQRRIINAALSEFAANGYRRTSTVDIASRAGISKGALFHYFGSKEGLYRYLLEWSAEMIQAELYPKLNLTETDFFARLLQASKLKLETVLACPELWAFWESFMSERPPFATDWIDDKMVELAPTQSDLLLKDVDTSRFKPGIDLGKMMNVLIWTFTGWSDAILAEARMRNERVDLRKVFKEADEYVEFLRTIFYREDVE